MGRWERSRYSSEAVLGGAGSVGSAAAVAAAAALSALHLAAQHAGARHCKLLPQPSPPAHGAGSVVRTRVLDTGLGALVSLSATHVTLRQRRRGRLPVSKEGCAAASQQPLALLYGCTRHTQRAPPSHTLVIGCRLKSAKRAGDAALAAWCQQAPLGAQAALGCVFASALVAGLALEASRPGAAQGGGIDAGQAGIVAPGLDGHQGGRAAAAAGNHWVVRGQPGQCAWPAWR